MGEHRFEIDVAGPFRLDFTVWALRRRAHNEIDDWDGTCYRRVAVLGGQPVQLTVRSQGTPSHTTLLVDLTGARRPLSVTVERDARAWLERPLGIKSDLIGFYALASRDKRLAPLAERFWGLRPPRFPNVFEALVNAVACQQLSLEVGIHLLNRLASRFGPRAQGRRQPGFPPPETLADASSADLRSLGFSQAKAHTILRLARSVLGGEIDQGTLEQAEDGKALKTLTNIPGIGRWSAEYTLLRGLGRWHLLPGDDVGARNNLRRRFGLAEDAGYEAVSELSRQWWPYGGLVYFHLLLDGLERLAPSQPALKGPHVRFCSAQVMGVREKQRHVDPDASINEFL